MSRERWAQAFTEKAAEHWTDARLDELRDGKRLAVMPDQAPLLLRAMGLLHRDASMPPKQVRKFLQINHMIVLLGPALRELSARHDELHILDAGCGRSYLSLLLAWVFEHRYDRPVRILGVDNNAKILAECQRRVEIAQLEHRLKLRCSPLDDLDLAEAWREQFGLVHRPALQMLISLHACDTATDDALGLALREEAELIAAAPCCQAELAAHWSALSEQDARGAFAPIWNSPHQRRELAASLTDSLRCLLLEAAGYQVRAVEFVPSRHTPKNTLIRAIRPGVGPSDGEDPQQVGPRDPQGALRSYVELRQSTGGCGIKLERLLPAALREDLGALEI